MSLSIATSAARGPSRLGSQALIACSAAVLQLAVDRRPDAQAALERLPRALLAAAELVDDLLLDPGGEVRVLGVLLRRLEVAALGQRLLDRVLRTAAGVRNSWSRM